MAADSRWRRLRFWLTHRCPFPCATSEGQRWRCPGCDVTYEVEWVEELTAVGNDALADIGGWTWTRA